MLGEIHPRAYGHLIAARSVRARLLEKWSEILDEEIFDVSMGCGPDGLGAITVHAAWPDGSREQLTELFRELVDRLWECLDSLIQESVEMFSVHQRVRDPHRPRFFPVADSDDGLADLLDESCLNGILRTQYQLVRVCQPHLGHNPDPRVSDLRTGLRRLVAWASRLADGGRMGGWVGIGSPRAEAAMPATVVNVTPHVPGELDEEFVVAEFTVKGYFDDCQLSGRADSHVDLAFAGFEPNGPQDTFSGHLRQVMDVVTRFVGLFEMFAAKVDGPRALPTLADLERPWVPAEESEQRWLPSELDLLATSDFGVGVVAGTDHFTMLITTEHGVYERRIPAATRPNPHLVNGIAVERLAQDAAATWGLPDFVIPPSVERKGRGVREISDGMILVGNNGLIMQVKSRSPRAIDTTSGDEAEHNWLNKNIAKATRQVNGTVRRLATATTMINGRGRPILIDGTTTRWQGVVIIDHPNPPQHYRPPAQITRTPIIVLLRRDWEFLFNQLKSCHAVLAYIQRVADDEPTPLGNEPIRYYELAAADAIAPPGPIDVEGVGGGEPVSVPLLPRSPAGSDDDAAHGMVRVTCEDIANSSTRPADENRLRHILSTIDALPVGYRTDLGRMLLDALAAAPHTNPDHTFWQLRTFRALGSNTQLGFGVSNQLTDFTRTAFQSWLTLRHHERGTAGGDLDTLTSIGILLTPRTDGLRDWDTTMLAHTGDPELDDTTLELMRDIWNRGRLSAPPITQRPRPSQVGIGGAGNDL
ncbi:hypothetical protein [Actinokineospora sp. UTMC 2448]|uniref:hypothetical protein n=1 Tax=Actinokineospora sp. UTMC 2448 TaxID=2268449 RepID=UPI0021645BEC|nr:hypothetical protein [Actinokineospora sp. UTMC 2448]UVS79421.1 hypothetical protein Actkin_03169 [Actinokineospora sp. UTMC 2448]